ncbi:hypothetical protein HNQ69_001578 [Bartonella callosciuri]|uniref:Uncharacterized protein n=1 Tax=Bartonella callosciuri TaxID=686223 RepID=A0A840NNV7_9HYPH|nr:hypothetical protein [Bartonella callosciuri]MBB5074436.1 hypothetical protein [Bartonella callosciuri]
MLSKPFALSEMSDPSQIRVVLYSGDRMVHAPLNGIVDLMKDVLKSEIGDSLHAIDARLRELSAELEDLKQCQLETFT